MIPVQLETQVYCKTDRIRRELLSGKLDLRLWAILVAVCAYILLKYRRIAEITDIWRPRAEQVLLYPDEPGKRSVHEFWRAIDLVVRGLGRAEHEAIRDWVNKRFAYGKRGHETCLYHDAGTGPHLHLQARPIE